MATMKQAVSRSGLYARETFLRLISTLTLVLSVVGFLQLTWLIVDRFWPDQIDQYLSPNTTAIPTAMLIISWPIYLFVAQLLQKDWETHEEMRDNAVRKWLIYFTLFAASVTLIIDAITTLYSFLSGELTLNFFVKSFSVLLVSGFVLFFYRNELQQSPTHRAVTKRLVAILASVAVLSAIVGGLIAHGGPFKQRALRLDEERRQDLENIQSAISGQWISSATLPTRLDELVTSYRIREEAVADPSGAHYEYRTLTERSYEFCAVFETDSEATSKLYRGNSLYNFDSFPDYYPYEGVISFHHGIGRTCFTRTLKPKEAIKSEYKQEPQS